MILVFARALAAVALAAASAPAPGAPGPPAPSDTIRLTDDLGRNLALPTPPDRIASLIPAATEILFALGAGERVSARSRFDDQPPEVRSLPSLGDAIRPSAERVLAHAPDVVLLFAGADNAGTIAEFDRLEIPTLAVRLNSLDDLRRVIGMLGRLVGRTGAADVLWAGIEAELEAVRRRTGSRPPRRVYYDVWYPPPITAGGGSYLDTLISLAGGRNVFADLPAPSPRVSLEAIVARDPELVLFPIGGDPAARHTPPVERPGWTAVGAVRQGEVRAVDADLVHRLGPRVGRAARALAEAIHPAGGDS